MASRYLLILLLCLSSHSHCHSLPNVPSAKFGPSPEPFVLHVDRHFVRDVVDRVRMARLPVEVQGLESATVEGPSLANYTWLREHWIHEYDWSSEEASINRELQQFTTTVQTPKSNYTHEIPLHFVHHKSTRADAIPLLFVHGWPGSFLEVRKIVDRLTNPPNASVPAFHVVAPSIPGFGFSPAPKYAGFGPTEAGHSFDSLMQQLGYAKYVVNGGDFGGIILRFMAASYPENVVSMLSNFWLIKPNSTDLARFAANQTTVDENTYLGIRQVFTQQRSGYRIMQQTAPLTAAYPLTDSPLGFTLWAYAFLAVVVDPSQLQWTADEVITWAMMYIIQGPYGGLRFYREVALQGAFDGLDYGHYPYVSQPVAVSQFPLDAGYDLPLAWARREGNVVQRTVNAVGGHLAAYEVPDLLAENLRAFFGDRALSNTNVFHARS
nr:putative epoxide hydrolase [Quercus suber]